MDGSSSLDPAGLAVLLARLAGVAEEGLAVLRRSASSPNIKERADCSTALFSADGELLAQSESIPVHLGSMPASVASVLDRVGSLAAGEQAIVNDPYAGGTHLNDVTVVAPVHHGGALVGWVANRAHHADVGGAAPGSIPADATHIAQEGLRLPPVRLGDDVRDVFLAASRTPEERAGDLDAQIGANRLMAERLVEVVDEGWPLAEVLAYGERRMRSALAGLPDGTWRFEDVLDSTGSLGAQRSPARIAVAVTVAGDAITFDFAGSEPQSGGNVNAVEAVTVSAVAFALRSATDPTIPANGGAMRPVRVAAPPGTVVAATFPAAVGAGNVEVSQRVADVCLGALAQIAPDRVGAADQGTMNNLLIGGDGWVYYETIAGGQGGRPDGSPGQSGIHTGMTNTKNTPVEALERAYPLRVLRYRLRRGSGGAGAATGGEGIERDLQVLEDCTVSLITERRVSQPWGLAGGGPGARGENWLLPGGDEALAERLADKCTVGLQAGDVVRMLTPGGGGWGEPVGAEARAPSAVAVPVELRPMARDAVAAFLARSVEVYVEELVAAGESPASARRRAEATVAESFPGNEPAPGHLLFDAFLGDERVGHLWLGPDDRGTDADWWVMDVEIYEGHRRAGLGRQVMALAEDVVRARGGTTIGLNVFGYNTGARRLYEALGYEPTSIRMRKPL